MNKTALLIAGGAAAAAIFFGNEARKIAQLNLSISKIGFKVKGLTAVLILDIKVANPSNAALQIDAITGVVHVNGSPIGNTSTYPKKTIAPLATTVIPIEANISLIGAGMELYQIYSGSKKAQASIRFAGTVNVNSVPMPADITYTIL